MEDTFQRLQMGTVAGNRHAWETLQTRHTETFGKASVGDFQPKAAAEAV